MRNTLLNAIEQGRQLNLDFVARLTDEEKATTGTFETWSGKDTLGHALFWMENLNIHIQQAMHGTPLTDYDDFNTHNAEDYPRKKPLTWPEMRELLNTIFDTTIRLIQEFPINEADLSRTDWEKWTGGTSLERAVLGTMIAHPLHHYTEFFIKQGHFDHAEAMVQEAIEMLAAYPINQGVVSYNLACHYALNQQPEKAFPLLREAFAKNESLKAWSQKDTDMDSLRNEPEFLAMVASTPEAEV